MMKYLAAIIVTAYLLMSIGCDRSGIEDGKMLNVSETTIADLEALLDTPKFKEDNALFYPGAPDDLTRQRASNILDLLISNLIRNIAVNPRSSFVLEQFEITLSQCNGFDSEEQDRICSYMEEIMDILGMESSEGVLNKWRYGSKRF